METIRLHFTGETAGLETGAALLAEDMDYEIDGAGMPVLAQRGEAGKLTVELEGDSARIAFDKPVHFFRGLGLMLEALRAGKTSFRKEETVYFTMNGPMLDVSQGNAVINIKTVKFILRKMALLGLNMMMLYCEDSYTVEGQPYFGYMRSRYSQEELRELDDYAYALGIEMIPCMQTLAHLTDALQWAAYADVKEDADCLLVGADRTYDIIRDLLKAASAPFRTRRIHIGMDEAWHLGRGRYCDLHGLVPGEKIMKTHLDRVMEIVREMGLQPMMWSDMFFRAACGDYFVEDVEFTQAHLDAAPRDMQLVYWDYYHDDVQDFYRNFVDKHRLFSEPVFAGGIWTWIGFGANWTKTFRTMNPALMAMKYKGVREVFATVWGDNGTECNALAIMPGLALFAEHGYNADPTAEDIERRFNAVCGGVYADFMAMQYLDETPGVPEGNMDPCNPSKYLLWQDVLCGVYDKNIEGLPLGEHYAALRERFEEAAARGNGYDGLFALNRALCRTLALKAEAGVRLTRAYRENDRETLIAMAREILPEILRRTEEQRNIHARLWRDTCKALGWEVLDMRYGSLMVRLRTAMEKVELYLAGKIPAIEELEEERLLFDGRAGMPRYQNFYGRMVSASRIAPTA